LKESLESKSRKKKDVVRIPVFFYFKNIFFKKIIFYFFDFKLIFYNILYYFDVLILKINF